MIQGLSDNIGGLEDSSSVNITDSLSQKEKQDYLEESADHVNPLQQRPSAKRSASSGLNSNDDDEDFESSTSAKLDRGAYQGGVVAPPKQESLKSSSARDSFDDSAALSRDFNYEESKESSRKSP